jgi:hypothetical protein
MKFTVYLTLRSDTFVDKVIIYAENYCVLREALLGYANKCTHELG